MKIKDELENNGQVMKSSALFSLFNISGFWGEAIQKNHDVKSRKVSYLLYIYFFYWLLVVMTYAILSIEK